MVRDGACIGEQELSWVRAEEKSCHFEASVSYLLYSLVLLDALVAPGFTVGRGGVVPNGPFLPDQLHFWSDFSRQRRAKAAVCERRSTCRRDTVSVAVAEELHVNVSVSVGHERRNA